MAHSYTNLLYHIVFATKGRTEWIDEALRPHLWAHLGKRIADEGGIALSINGIADHVHILAKLRPDKSVSQVVSNIKSRSSGWIHRARADLASFAWQTGYGAFTLGPAQVPDVRRYIENQEEHHRREPYDQELRMMLRLAGLDADDRFYWE
jgi:REP element-mobilizing transposase RayT